MKYNEILMKRHHIRGNIYRRIIYEKPEYIAISAFTGSLVLSAFFITVNFSVNRLSESSFLSEFILFGHLSAMIFFGSLIIKLLKIDASYLLTPLAGFLICCVVFFGFGGLSTVLMDGQTRSYLERNAYMLSDEEQVRGDILTFLGTSATFLGIYFGLFSINLTEKKERIISLKMSATIILCVGILIKYGIIIPSKWGYYSWVVPGTIEALSLMPDVGFLLLALAIARGESALKLIFVITWILYLFLCVFEFSKTATTFAILMPGLGIFIGTKRLRNFLPWLVAALGLLIVTQNIFLNAREDVLRYSGVEDQAPIEQRVVSLFDGVKDALDSNYYVNDALDSPPELWWARLNYAGAQVRAMELYDRGITGSWILYPQHFLIPRLLWPNKPELEDIAMNFNRIVSGNSGTLGRVAITIYGEGYWIGGWLIVFVFAIIAGISIGILTNTSMHWLRSGSYLYFPVILMAFKIGIFDLLGFFQTSFIGGLFNFITLSLLIKLCTQFASVAK